MAVVEIGFMGGLIGLLRGYFWEVWRKEVVFEDLGGMEYEGMKDVRS
ncbi:hypothetical protein [Staphylococcus aureus]|nr:hypothetical protein [Staphylococcus aureus]